MLRAILLGLFLYLILRWALRVLQVMGAITMGQGAQRRSGWGTGRGRGWPGGTGSDGVGGSGGMGGSSGPSGGRRGTRGRIDLSRIEEADFEEIQDTKRENDRS